MKMKLDLNKLLFLRNHRNIYRIVSVVIGEVQNHEVFVVGFVNDVEDFTNHMGFILSRRNPEACLLTDEGF